jgi:large subunit ribosomal protein L24
MGTQIKVGDLVQVMSGSRQRNPEKPPSRGRVLAVDRERGLVTVEGHNQRVRHLKQSPRHPQAGRVKREMPVHVSNVMLVTEDGRPVRVSKVRREGARVVAGAGAPRTATKEATR